MPNIIFTKGEDTFQFSKGREFPIADPAQINVPTDMSDGGQLYAYNKGIAEKLWNLVFKRLTQTDYDNFDEWLTDIAVGPANTFTLTDELAAEHTVRLLDTKNPLEAGAEDDTGFLYSGTIRLREEI
jgi:hypothetical protein